jgi:hypothetical protein
MTIVKEIAIFRLIEGTNTDAFLTSAQATFDLLASYDGFIERELTVNEDGTWFDLVTWRDMDAALRAAEQIMSSKIGQTFGSHIDMSSLQMNHAHPKISSKQHV